jgi:hypothetical protein
VPLSRSSYDVQEVVGGSAGEHYHTISIEGLASSVRQASVAGVVSVSAGEYFTIPITIIIN